MIESMDRLAIIQGQTIVQTTIGFKIKWTIESMTRLPIIQGQKVVERTVRVLNKERLNL